MAEIQKVIGREGLADSLYEEYRARESEKDDLRAPKEKEIQHYTDKINRLLDLVEQGFKTTDTLARLNEYNERRQVLQDELRQINTDYGFTRRHFTEFFDHLLVTVTMTGEDSKKTLDYLVEKIDLYPDGEVKVLLKFSFDGVDKAGAGSGT